jgi:hypothetical protein
MTSGESASNDKSVIKWALLAFMIAAFGMSIFALRVTGYIIW